MKCHLYLSHAAVKLLTLSVAFLAGGCALIHPHEEKCNSHAYVQEDLADYISNRFHTQSPVRMAIVPFTVPANLTGYGEQRPDVGQKLAWRVHAEFLRSEQIPIVEVFDRADWPAKKEEFFRGNFGAMAQAREAGYDLLLVGLVEQTTDINSMTSYSKIIDVELGVTIWYGKVTASTGAGLFQDAGYRVGLIDQKPAMLYMDSLIDEVANCTTRSILKEREWPTSAEGEMNPFAKKGGSNVAP